MNDFEIKELYDQVQKMQKELNALKKELEEK